MGGARDNYGGTETRTRFWRGKERNYFEDLGEDWRMILKRILKK